MHNFSSTFTVSHNKPCLFFKLFELFYFISFVEICFLGPPWCSQTPQKSQNTPTFSLRTLWVLGYEIKKISYRRIRNQKTMISYSTIWKRIFHILWSEIATIRILRYEINVFRILVSERTLTFPCCRVFFL
jgi:hypothetical protein